MKAKQALEAACTLLENAGVPSAQHDARQLLSHVLQTSPMAMAAGEMDLTAEQIQQFDAVVGRRCAREPLQYILGEAWFMGYRFQVAPGVLIPRFDTEVVCQAALKDLPQNARVLDLCTGSGALAVAIYKERPDCTVHASDLSEQALHFARLNAQANHAAVTFFAGDFFAPIKERYHLVVCNPPYIPAGDMATLQKEVQQEPALALDGGADGLTFYRRLLAEAPHHLFSGGRVVLELGDGQAEAVRALAAAHFTNITVEADLGGLPRALTAHLKEEQA